LISVRQCTESKQGPPIVGVFVLAGKELVFEFFGQVRKISAEEWGLIWQEA
jgi:hypothetical protein